MYKVDVTPVVGLPQFSGWSQVASSYHSSGQLVCAFSISGDHAGNVGRDLTEQISQAQARSSQELHKFMAGLIKEIEQFDVTLTLVCGVFKANRIILGVSGGSVFLKRSNRTGILLSSLDDLKIIEGKRKAGDIVVLATAQASDFLNEIEQKFISGFDTDSVVTSIIPGLHGLDDSSLSSIAFVTGGREFKEDIEIVPDEIGVVEEVEKIKEVEEIKEVEVGVKEEQLLDIPPALRLRGAGKNRNADGSILHTQNTAPLSLSEQDLSKLGQIKPPYPALIVFCKVWRKINSLSGKIAFLVKSIHWQQFLIKLVQILSRLKNLMIKTAQATVVLVRRLIAKDIYLKPQSPRHLIRVVLPIVAGIIVVVSLIGFMTLKIRKQVKAANAVLTPITAQIVLAKNQVTTDPILARETVSQAIIQLIQLEQDFKDQKQAKTLVSDQLTTARELFDQISGQEEFGQLEIFYDLRLVDGEFVASSVDATSKQVVLLDADRKQAIVLDLEKKQVSAIDLSIAKRLIDLKITDQTLTVLGQGIFQKDLGNENSVLSAIIAEGDSNKTAILLESFATYIYVLNPEKRNIYRYAKQEKGYSDPIGWMSGAVSFDYHQASSWAIDGDVWVTTREGGLHKLASGREQEFKIVGLAEPFSQNLQITTSEDLENLYLLEPAGKRLVILTKKGEFLKEIKSDSLASTTTLFVSEELKKVFAVSGSIVYAMSI